MPFYDENWNEIPAADLSSRNYGSTLDERRSELQDYANRLRNGTSLNEQLKDEFWDETEEERKCRHSYNSRLADRIERDMQNDPNYDGYGEIGYMVVKNSQSHEPVGSQYIRVPQPRSNPPHIVSITTPRKRITTKQRLIGRANDWREKRDEKYRNYIQNDVSHLEEYEQTKIGIQQLANTLTNLAPPGSDVSNGWSGDDDGYYLDFYFTDSHGFNGQQLADTLGMIVRIMDDHSVRIYYDE